MTLLAILRHRLLCPPTTLPPTHDSRMQSDGIAPRGIAFGMPAIRVDGNDILAVYTATQVARKIAMEEGKPSMIESMSYRINSHSTSDDDSKYRRKESPTPGYASERDYWEARSPIIRFGKYLERLGLWTAAHEAELRQSARKRAINALNNAESIPGPHPRHLFSDVYDSLPWFLREQQAALKEHLQTYREHYVEIPAEQIETL